MMKCEKVTEYFLKMDNRLTIPFMVRVHIFFCRRCLYEISYLIDQFNSIKNEPPFEMEIDISNSIMEKISELHIIHEQNVSSVKWLTVGSIILASIFLLPFSESLSWLRIHFAGNLEIPLSIVLGLVISIYAIIYIATHLDELKHLIHYHEKKI